MINIILEEGPMEFISLNSEMWAVTREIMCADLDTREVEAGKGIHEAPKNWSLVWN
jgi:hypothetical protein